MLYKTIQIPVVLEIGNDILKNIDDILNREHLYFDSKILFTSEELYSLFIAKLDVISFKEIHIIKGGKFEESNEISLETNIQDSLLIAFGGGSIIDLVKVIANRFNMPYLTIPSALSNDSIYSPVARLNKRGRKKSFGVPPPIGIIADIDIIKTAPVVLQLSGVGDLVSNLSAIKDWKLSNEIQGEAINNFALALSSQSAMRILHYTIDDIGSDNFIKDLANGLIISGLAMIIAKNTRPASGSEHLISHAIDELYPERSTFHGLQVAYGQLFIEKNIRKDIQDFQLLDNFFNKIGLKNEIENRINFSNSEINKIIEKAKTMRNRYTILSHEKNISI
jgi:glycerol-1-phosphate dehydrogenase [NAD(P)+]